MKQLILAQYLKIDTNKISQGWDENTFEINKRMIKDGKSPLYYKESIAQLKDMLRSVEKYSYQYHIAINHFFKRTTELAFSHPTLKQVNNLKCYRQRLYNRLSKTIEGQPVIKDWLYNANILYYLLGMSNDKKLFFDLMLLWRGKDITDSRELREVNDGEYTILTEEEADEKCKDQILDSLWAFNSSFIIDHSSTLDYDDGSEKILEAIQAQCEGGNEAVKKLIDDLDEFVEDAISADGRGAFMSTYDGDEEEFQYNNKTYYIYRNN